MESSRTVPRLAATVLFFLCPPTLAAQDLPPALQGEPLLRLRMEGPATLAKTFAETALGQAREQEDFVAVGEMLSRAMGPLSADLESFGELWSVIGRCPGPIELQLMAEGFEAVPRWSLFVRFAGVDSDPELFTELQSGLARVFGGEAFRGIDREAGTLQLRLGGGEPLEPAPWLGLGDAPILITGDPLPLLSGVSQLPTLQGPGPAEILDAFGLLSLGRIELRFTPRGRAVEITGGGAVDGTKGLWPMLRRSAENGGARSLDLIPRGVDIDWNVTCFDLGSFFSRVLQLAILSGDADELGGMLAMATDAMGGVSPSQMIRCLGREWVYYTAGISVEDEEGALVGVDDDAGVCVAVELTDRELFESTLEGLLRQYGLHAARRTREHGDDKLHSLMLLGVQEIHYAFADDRLWIGMEKAGLDLIQAGIDNAANPSGKRGAFDPDSERHLQQLGRDWDQITSTSMVRLFESIGEQMEREGERELAAAAFRLARGLDAIGARRMVSGARITDERWEGKTLW